MNKQEKNPYAALERVYHEPSRLAIMSSLAAAREGMTFNELKQECELTDGNLSRHLKALEDIRAVKIKKSFVGAKPRTTVYLTETGRESFLEYLKTLEEVLKKAAEAMDSPVERRPMASLLRKRPATA